MFFKGLGDLGQLAGLMSQLPKIREEFEKLQGQLARTVAEGEAGAGMVKARVSGQLQLLGVMIAPDALNDREMLEDLVTAAVNQAMEKARSMAAEETGKVARGFGLPPGMGLPGLS